ncbi:MAG: phosphoribosylformylglycinamidine synthase subunit PurL [Myxococcales bacterium]
MVRVEVAPRPGTRDARGEALASRIETLGVRGIDRVTVTDLVLLDGALDDRTLARLMDELLCDPVVQTWRRVDAFAPEGGATVEVALRPGVTDSAAESLLVGARMAGIEGLSGAALGQRYTLVGDLDAATVRRIARGLLANEVIQVWALDAPVPAPFVAPHPADDTVETVPLSAADDDALLAISKARRLSLDLAEMRAIAAFYRDEGREPTDVELEMLAQTWSEHCVHKTFRALIDYEERDESGATVQRATIDSLMKTFIRAATEAAARPWVRSAFVDNAGIVALDDRWDLAFKVETHNHPSALEPFGGANTGVGGVVRDVIGVSARPIATTDVLCFGPPDLPFAALPDGVLHPSRIAEGVVAGIEDYGNKMGIPTVNGAIVYDPGYTANPLVYCGCLGVLPHGAHKTGAQPGDLVVCIGGRTGRDGLRGATFSSMEMSHETGEVAGSSVQIGHPIHEKQALDAVMIARDEGLYHAITDCGAGGLSSAVGEMAEHTGARVDLRTVPLKYAGLRPWEIWLSEAQERMVLAVPPTSWERLAAICAGLDIDCTAIGTFTGDGEVVVTCGDTVVARLPGRFLHDGIPRRSLRGIWQPPRCEEPATPSTPLGPALLSLLATPGIRSKEEVVRLYDHEVQGGTVVKPFVGSGGPSDAAVIVPIECHREGGRTGVALAVGINPRYGAIDPYAMAWAAVDEAVRNVVAVGGDPDRLSLLDNFCWGNPALPDRLGGLVRCAEGCHDAAVAFGAPFVSGKDSLNNEYTGADGQRHAIPGTILISALAVVPDVRSTVTSDLKGPGNLLYVVGATADELGGSAWYALHAQVGANVPQPVEGALDRARAMHRAVVSGLVRACHDCSDGGLLVAVAEMALGGGLGAEIDLRRVPTQTDRALPDPALAFSESLGRWVVEVERQHAPAFEAALAGEPHAVIGCVRSGDRLVVTGHDGVADVPLPDLARAFRGHVPGAVP